MNDPTNAKPDDEKPSGVVRGVLEHLLQLPAGSIARTEAGEAPEASDQAPATTPTNPESE